MCDQQKAIYTIFVNGMPYEEVEEEGVAHLKLESANLIGVGELVKFIPGDDKILCGYYTYNQEFKEWQHGFNVAKRPTPVDKDSGIPPVCEKNCKWLKRFNNFNRQSNSLRLESSHMVAETRCGWNLKPGKIGGHPLDYAPCDFDT